MKRVFESGAQRRKTEKKENENLSKLPKLDKFFTITKEKENAVSANHEPPLHVNTSVEIDNQRPCSSTEFERQDSVFTIEAVV